MPTKPATKKAAKPQAAAGTKAPRLNSVLSKKLTPSPQLAAIVGAEPLPRTEVVSKVWEYIRTHNLQNPENKREILADDAMRAVFGRTRPPCSR